MTYLQSNLFGQVEAMKRARGVDDVRHEMKRHRQALRAKLDEHEVAVKGETPEPPVRWGRILAAVSGAVLVIGLLVASLT